MLTVLFFGQLKELLNTTELKIEGEYQTVAELRQQLQKKGENWQEFLAHGRALVAVNQTMSNEQSVLSDNDEVAFFPPVTGG